MWLFKMSPIAGANANASFDITQIRLIIKELITQRIHYSIQSSIWHVAQVTGRMLPMNFETEKWQRLLL